MPDELGWTKDYKNMRPLKNIIKYNERVIFIPIIKKLMST